MNAECRPYLQYLHIGASTSSLMASFTMAILCFIRLRSNCSYIWLISGIACSDLIYSVSNMLSLVSQKHRTICTIEAITREWSFNFSFFFVVALSILCYKSCLAIEGLAQEEQRAPPNQKIYFRNVLIFGSIICLALSLQIIWFSKYVTVVSTGTGGLCCSISANDKASYSQKVIVRTIYQGIPNSISLAIALVCYYRSYSWIGNTLEIRNSGRNNIFYFLIVLCLILLPGLIDGYFRIGKECEQEWLLVLHIVLTHSAGTLNAGAYGLHEYARTVEEGPRRSPLIRPEINVEEAQE